MIAKRVHFRGQVQGVGFRYTTQALARRGRVTGYVANLPDGRVELHVEGPEQEVNDLIDSVRREMQPYIHDVSSIDMPPTGKYHRFVIRYF